LGLSLALVPHGCYPMGLHVARPLADKAAGGACHAARTPRRPFFPPPGLGRYKSIKRSAPASPPGPAGATFFPTTSPGPASGIGSRHAHGLRVSGAFCGPALHNSQPPNAPAQRPGGRGFGPLRLDIERAAHLGAISLHAARPSAAPPPGVPRPAELKSGSKKASPGADAGRGPFRRSIRFVCCRAGERAVSKAQEDGFETLPSTTPIGRRTTGCNSSCPWNRACANRGCSSNTRSYESGEKQALPGAPSVRGPGNGAVFAERRPFLAGGSGPFSQLYADAPRGIELCPAQGVVASGAVRPTSRSRRNHELPQPRDRRCVSFGRSPAVQACLGF